MFGGYLMRFAFVRRAFLYVAGIAFLSATLAVAATVTDDLARGNAALEAKDFDGARAIYDGILQVAPENVAALVGRGRAFREKDDYEHALADYTEALRRDPKSKHALWYRHHLYTFQDDYQKALVDISALLELEPQNVIDLRQRARTYRRLKNFALALADVERAIAVKSDDPANFEERATIFESAGSYVEAVDDLSTALRLKENCPAYFTERGRAYQQLGRDKEALDDFLAAVRLDSRNSDPLNACAWFMATCENSGLQDGAKAVEYATKACELTGWKRAAVLDTLAAACARAGDFENAVQRQEQAIQHLGQKSSSEKEMRERLALYQRKEAYVEPLANKEKVEWSRLRSDCFETVWKLVNENYFDTTFGGVDWKAVREKFRLRLWAAEDKRALRRLLQEMLDELHRTHFGIVPREMAVLNPEERGRIGFTGANAMVLEDVVMISWVKSDSPAEKAGIKAGDVVRRVDTHALSEMAETMGENVISARKRLQNLCGFVNWWLSAPVGKEVVLLLENDKGVQREVKMVAVPHEGVWSEAMGFSPSRPVEYEVNRSAEDVVYLRFNTFALPAMNEFKRCVRMLKSGDGLIIDLRNNPGGLTLMAPGIYGRLSAKETSLGTMRRRYGTEDFMAYPQRGAFLGPVAVLVDSASASTSEILAAGLKDSGRARIFGEVTAGAALPSMFGKLPTGDMLQYAVADIKTPHGVLIEGTGVTPDEIVQPKRSDFIAGRDPVREAAERWLKKQLQNSGKDRVVAK